MKIDYINQKQYKQTENLKTKYNKNGRKKQLNGYFKR